jgi:uncharacterized protein YqgC (DUF456 family)
MTEFQQVKTTDQQAGRARPGFTFQTTQLIWLFLGLLEAAFALRFLLRLIGADPASTLVTLLYSFTAVFLLPFAGIVLSPALGSLVLELTTMLAMAVYAGLGVLLARTAWNIFYRPYAAGPVIETTIFTQLRP